jgi:tetratricopeptide (TPR) repeat protein
MSVFGPPGSPSALSSAIDANVTVLHQPFFGVLAHLEGKEAGTDWQPAVAGLVVLRLLDARIERAHRSRDDSFDARARAAQHAAAAVEPANPCATALAELCEAISVGRLATVARRLLAYARALSDDNRWQLAGDAYVTLLRLTETPPFAASPSARTIVPFAYNRLGRSFRMTGDLTRAARAYAAGTEAARLQGDRQAELRIRIGEAQILLHLGNLPAAAAALDAVIADAEAERLRSDRRDRPGWSRLSTLDEALEREDVGALARHDRGAIAANQGDLSIAIQLYYAAWRSYRDPVRRERVWADIAHALSTMNLRQAARDAYLVLSTRNRQRELRLIASVNLLELAALDGRQQEYDDHRRILHAACAKGLISPRLAALFALVEGESEARFGRPTEAMTALERALAIATQYSVNEVIIRADRALARVRAGRAPVARDTPSTEEPIPPAVERITRAVRRIRRRAESASHLA